MKPGDFFLGVVDFFSTLIPGAIAVYLVIDQPWIARPEAWPAIRRNSTEGWAVFLVSAYVVGHIVASFASVIFDKLYDRVYVRWRRASAAYVRSNLPEAATRRTVLRTRLGHVLRKTNPDDELLAVAKKIKSTQLQRIARSAYVDPLAVSNTFWWSGTVVRLLTSSGAAEVEALSAQSKLFRSLAVLVPIVAVFMGWATPMVIVAWLALFIFVIWRFFKLRWDATERMYEYYIAAHVLPVARSQGTPPNSG